MPEGDEQNQGPQDGGGSGQVTIDPDDLRSLREKAERADGITDLQRENAMLRAGVNTDERVGQLFADNYDGELDADQIADSFETFKSDLGVPASGPEENYTSEEERATDERQGLSRQSEAPDAAPATDPYEDAAKAAEQVRAGGGRHEDAVATFVGSLAGAAQEGNTDVMHDPAQWRQRQQQQVSR